MGVDSETPSFLQVIEFMVERRLLDLHVSLPAEIIKYDGVRAEVRPLLKRQLRDADGTELELPVITDVPVIWPRTALAEIHLPLKKGDTGTLLFAERSLDQWLVAGGSVNPRDYRKHDLSDAQFIPGLKDFSKPSAYDPDRVVLKHDQTLMTMTADGRFAFGNGVEELMDLVRQLIDKVSETEEKISVATTNTIFGPLQLNNFADFIVLQGEIDTIGTKWDTLKE